MSDKGGMSDKDTRYTRSREMTDNHSTPTPFSSTTRIILTQQQPNDASIVVSFGAQSPEVQLYKLDIKVSTSTLIQRYVTRYPLVPRSDDLRVAVLAYEVIYCVCVSAQSTHTKAIS